MKIVPAKPPYRYGIRKIMTAQELGIDVKPYVEQSQEDARSATVPEKELETAPEVTETAENTDSTVVEAEIPAPETASEPETDEKPAEATEEVTETAEEAEPARTLKDLNLSSTARRALKANGISTIEELKAFIDSGKTAQDLSGCSAKTREALQEEFSKLQNE